MGTREGQGVKTAEHQILTRIGFAERWLQRAREECLDGNVARGVLTLVLADAEVRRLLQLSGAPLASPRSSRVISLVAVGIAVVLGAALALQLGVLALGAAPTESAALPTALTLRAGTGALLEPLAAIAPPVAESRPTAVPTRPTSMIGRPARSPVTFRPAQVPQTVVRAAPVQVTPPVAAPAAVSSPPPAVPAPGPTVVSAPVPSVTLSGVDLLDLVIVADRTLRRSQPSP